MDTKRIPPAGDPFTSEAVGQDQGQDQGQDHPHACLNGYVYLGYTYLGYTYVGEDGEEVEAFEAIPCRRCASEAGR